MLAGDRGSAVYSDATVKLITKTLSTMAADKAVGRSEALRRSMVALIDIKARRTRRIPPIGRHLWWSARAAPDSLKPRRS